MANTYEAITTVTVGSGGASTIEFTSIPATYTDLCVQISPRSDRAATQDVLLFTVNNNTSNRSFLTIEGRPGTPSTVSFEDTTVLFIGAIAGNTMTASTFSSASLYIPNYASSNNKSFSSEVVAEGNTSIPYLTISANLWSNSSAITSIQLYLETSGTKFMQYSTATLYGIKNS